MWTGRARSWQYSRPAVRRTERHGPREMENIRRGPAFGDFATILTREVDAGRHGCKTTEYKSTDYGTLSPLF